MTGLKTSLAVLVAIAAFSCEDVAVAPEEHVVAAGEVPVAGESACDALCEFLLDTAAVSSQVRLIELLALRIDSIREVQETRVRASVARMQEAAGYEVRGDTLSAITLLRTGPLHAYEVRSQVQAPLLSLTREMRIDGVDNNLASIGWAVVWNDGLIAFSQTQDRQVLFYDAAGQRLGTFGRAGQGPGEFDFPNYAGLAGDTLWVRDTRQNRVSLITRNRVLAGTIETARANPRPNETMRYSVFNFAFPVSISPNGGMITSGIRSRGAVLPAQFDTTGTPFLRVNRRMEIEGIPFRKPEQLSSTSISVSLPNGGSASSVIPFTPRDLESWSTDGTLWAFATADTGARASSFRLVLLRSSGDTVFARRFPIQVERIPARVADSAVSASIQRLNSGPMPPELVTAFRTQVKVPPIYPPLSMLRVGRDGSVWVGLRSNGSTRTWLVFDRQGNPAGQVQLPGNALLLEATLDQLWVRELDADDVNSVVRYRIGRLTGQRASGMSIAHTR